MENTKIMSLVLMLIIITSVHKHFLQSQTFSFDEAISYIETYVPDPDKQTQAKQQLNTLLSAQEDPTKVEKQKIDTILIVLSVKVPVEEKIFTIEEEKESIRQEWKKRQDANRQTLLNPNKRIMPLLKDLQKYPLIHLLSLRQPGGWLCGPLVFYNIRMLETAMYGKYFNFKQLEVLARKGLFLDYSNYTWENAQKFYNKEIIRHIWKEKTLKPDELTGLLCPQPRLFGDRRQNYLGTDDIQSLISNLNLTSKCFILTMAKKDAPIEIENIEVIQRTIEIGKPRHIISYDYLKDRCIQFLSNPKEQLLHFVCLSEKTGGGHWILVSIFKDHITSKNLAMILLDSKNAAINEETKQYINYLAEILLPEIFYVHKEKRELKKEA